MSAIKISSAAPGPSQIRRRSPSSSGRIFFQLSGAGLSGAGVRKSRCCEASAREGRNPPKEAVGPAPVGLPKCAARRQHRQHR